MRIVIPLALALLPGCFAGHSVEAIPTAYDHLEEPRVATREVRICTFDFLGFLPVAGPNGRGSKHHHSADAVNLLESEGPHAGITVESIVRWWGILGVSECTYASGRPVQG